MKGTLFGVGVGPGDPDLLTLKAARLIASVPAIAFLCNREGRSRARDTARGHISARQTEIAIPMTFDADRASVSVAYREAAARISAQLDQGNDVAALCEGDPLLYGSFIHIMAAIGAHYPCEVIPGISSLTAAAAAARKALVSGGERLVVVPANAGEDAISEALQRHDSIAILKPGKNRRRVLELLRDSGRLSETVYVSAATQETQIIVNDLRDLPSSAGPYFALFLVSRH